MKLVLLAAVWHAVLVYGQSDVRIENLTALNETVYEVLSSDCKIRWVMSHSAINEGIARHRTQCRLAMDQQVAINRKILAQVLPREPKFRMLFLGPMGPFPQLSVRLAVLAKQSPGWDVRTGRPKSGPVDAFLLDLMKAHPTMFEEWRLLFRDFQLSFGVAGVEESSVAEARSLPYFKQLAAQGVSPRDKLPYDGLLWFSAARNEK